MNTALQPPIKKAAETAACCDHDHDEHHPHHAPTQVLKVGRNDPCPCGSLKKYKKCCLV